LGEAPGKQPERLELETLKTISLVEETNLLLPRGQLSDEQAMALSSDRRFTLDWPNPANGFQFCLRSNGWVGHLPVGEAILVVEPKVPAAQIFAMLELAYKLKSFEILEGETFVEALEDIFERIAHILAKRVLDRSRKGLYRSYVDRSDDLQFVRGRIDIRGNLRSALCGEPRLRCQYQELTADVEDNVILLWTLRLASRLGFKREDVRRNVRQAYRTLIGDVSLDRRSGKDCIGRFYHRLNDDYQPMHGLCRFLLEHAGPAISVGEHRFLPFAVNMPKLFESFVAEWLALNLPDELSVDPQYKVKLDSNADLEFHVDLVVRDRASHKPLCILDTKYKLGESVNEADIQQVVAYAVELGVTQAFLVYPNAMARRVRAKVGDVKVESIAFDVASDFALSGKALLSAVSFNGASGVPR